MRNSTARSAQWLVVVALGQCGLVARGEEIPAKPVEGKIKWVYSYDEGKKLARESGKPMFVVFRCER